MPVGGPGERGVCVADVWTGGYAQAGIERDRGADDCSWVSLLVSGGYGRGCAQLEAKDVVDLFTEKLRHEWRMRLLHTGGRASPEELES